MANPDDQRDDLFRLYLTRNLPDGELAELSDRLLREPELSDELRDFEIEWIDSRARGELSPSEEAQVDAYLAHTGQQHRLATARRFLSAQGASAASPRRRPSLYWLAAAAALVLGIFALQSNKPAAPPPTTASAPAPVAPFAVLLTPGTRSAEPRRVTLPPGTTQVELKLALDAPLPPGSYQASLQSATGQALFTQPVAHSPGEASLSLKLPAATLPPASYRVLLFPANNTEDLINAYSFELVSGTRK
ncbi:MAG: hypothetical protein ABI972_12455 [Acidobacteriota bacterium]